jgi:hypothetical protein
MNTGSWWFSEYNLVQRQLVYLIANDKLAYAEVRGGECVLCSFDYVLSQTAYGDPMQTPSRHRSALLRPSVSISMQNSRSRYTILVLFHARNFFIAISHSLCYDVITRGIPLKFYVDFFALWANVSVITLLSCSFCFNFVFATDIK